MLAKIWIIREVRKEKDVFLAVRKLDNIRLVVSFNNQRIPEFYADDLEVKAIALCTTKRVQEISPCCCDGLFEESRWRPTDTWSV